MGVYVDNLTDLIDQLLFLNYFANGAFAPQLGYGTGQERNGPVCNFL